MSRVRPRALAIGAILGLLATACTSTGVGRGPSVSPPVRTTSPSLTMSPTPTPSPGPDSSLATGVASIVLSGDLTLTRSLSTLGSPTVWAPPPAPMDLTWEGGRGQELGLAGTSFLSRAETAADRALTLTVLGPDGPVEFTSTAGECSVTITPALPDNMGGVFTCTALVDVEGVTTVDARGIFSASG